MVKEKIVVLVGSNCGGAERVSVLFAKILHQNGYQVQLLVYRKKNSSNFPLKPFIPDYLPFVEVAYTAAKLMVFDILKEIRRIKPDLVFSSISTTNNNVLLLKKLRLINCRVIIRMNTSPKRLSNQENRVSRRLYPLADVIISQTEEMKSEMMEVYKLPSSLITVVHNPVDTKLIDDKIKEKVDFDSSCKHFVAVGRMNPIKDYPTMLSAFATLHQRNPNTMLHVVGKKASAEQMERIQTFLIEHDIEKSVFFEGFQSNPYKYMAAGDAFVLSSIIEGLPNALLEAMYLGVPVVTTDCFHFVNQLVKNGENGYVVSVKDVNAMADAMEKSLTIRRSAQGQYENIQQEELIINIFNKTLRQVKNERT